MAGGPQQYLILAQIQPLHLEALAVVDAVDDQIRELLVPPAEFAADQHQVGHVLELRLPVAKLGGIAARQAQVIQFGHDRQLRPADQRPAQRTRGKRGFEPAGQVAALTLRVQVQILQFTSGPDQASRAQVQLLHPRQQALAAEFDIAGIAIQPVLPGIQIQSPDASPKAQSRVSPGQFALADQQVEVIDALQGIALGDGVVTPRQTQPRRHIEAEIHVLPRRDPAFEMQRLALFRLEAQRLRQGHGRAFEIGVGTDIQAPGLACPRLPQIQFQFPVATTFESRGKNRRQQPQQTRALDPAIDIDAATPLLEVAIDPDLDRVAGIEGFQPLGNQLAAFQQHSAAQVAHIHQPVGGLPGDAAEIQIGGHAHRAGLLLVRQRDIQVQLQPHRAGHGFGGLAQGLEQRQLLDPCKAVEQDSGIVLRLGRQLQPRPGHVGNGHRDPARLRAAEIDLLE